MNSRHPCPRRVLGWCRAAVRGPDPLDPGDPGDPLDPRMGSFFRVLGVKNNENENPAALGGCGGLGQLWEALAELWEALGELWEALYIQKLPINRTSGRYVIAPCGAM